MKFPEYIKGLRKGKEARHIERKAMEDPLLSDAMDGYDSVKGDHTIRIKEMQKRITQRSQSRRNQWRSWSVAAGILLCVSIGGYYFLKNDQRPDLYSINQLEKIPEPVITQEIAENAAEKDTISPKQEELAQYPIKEEIRDEAVSEKMIRSVEEPAQSAVSKEQLKDAAPDKKAGQINFELAEIPAKSDTLTIPSRSIASERIGRSQLQPTLQGASAGVLASQKQIRGKIVDEHGDPMIGASIIQKGTKTGAITGLDGGFTLNTNNSAPLVANYIGFDPTEMAIDTTAPMLIAMKENKQLLDEVVVVGYATAKKSNVDIESDAEPKPQPMIGMKAYQEYLKNNMIRPKDTLCEGKKGTVVLEFSIDSNGKPINIRVRKSVCSSIDQEAIRLVAEGSRWSAGNDKVSLKVKF